MNTENNNTAVIYARVSSVGDRQNTERQVADLSALAIQKGLSIEKVYEEHVSGAKKNIDRPVLTECLDYCKSQHIGILLVSELSRLGRNTFEVLSTVKDLMDCGINVNIGYRRRNGGVNLERWKIVTVRWLASNQEP